MTNADRNLIKSIYNPPQTKDTEARFDIQSLYPDRHVQIYAFARQALRDGLLALDLRPEDLILIPGFICRDVLSSFASLNLRIQYYSVDQDLIPKDLENLPSAKAIMAVHYFGFETDLEPFKKYCKKHDAFLIEDNAHGFLSGSSQGALGTLGDIGVISVRKTVPTENGALLIARKDFSLPAPPIGHSRTSFRLGVKNLIRPLVALESGIRILLALTTAKRKIRRWLKGSDLPPPDPHAEVEIPDPKVSADFLPDLYKMNIQKERDRRRKLFEHVRNILQDEPIRPLRRQLSPEEVPYAFPFFCDEKLLEPMRSKLLQSGFEITSWPELPSAAPPHTIPLAQCEKLFFVKFLW